MREGAQMPTVASISRRMPRQTSPVAPSGGGQRRQSRVDGEGLGFWMAWGLRYGRSPRPRHRNQGAGAMVQRVRLHARCVANLPPEMHRTVAECSRACIANGLRPIPYMGDVAARPAWRDVPTSLFLPVAPNQLLLDAESHRRNLPVATSHGRHRLRTLGEVYLLRLELVLSGWLQLCLGLLRPV